MAVSIEYDIDVSARIDDRGFAAQLDDFSEDADDAVLKGAEVWGEDARGLGVVHLREWEVW